MKKNTKNAIVIIVALLALLMYIMQLNKQPKECNHEKEVILDKYKGKQADTFEYVNALSEYSQISNSKHCFIRNKKNNIFEIYENIKKIGKFLVNDEYMQIFGVMKHNNEYFVKYFYESDKIGISRINLETESIDPPIKSLMESESAYAMEFAYNNNIYFVNENKYYMNQNEKHYILEKYNISNLDEFDSEMVIQLHNGEKMEIVGMVDGNIIYQLTSKNKCSLWKYDLKKKKSNHFFELDFTENENEIIRTEYVFYDDTVLIKRVTNRTKNGLELSYIYEKEIGGECKKLFVDKVIDCVKQDNVYIYLDSNCLIHNIQHNLEKDTIISSKKYMKITATKNVIWAQQYEKKLVHGDDCISENYNVNIDAMDFRGKSYTTRKQGESKR